MTKIFYKDNTFYLLENWPDKFKSGWVKTEFPTSTHESGRWLSFVEERRYNNATEECKANAIRVSNPELLPVSTQRISGKQQWFDNRSKDYSFIKEGDTFDFPENLKYELKIKEYPFETFNTDTVAILNCVQEEPKKLTPEQVREREAVYVNGVKYVPEVLVPEQESQEEIIKELIDEYHNERNISVPREELIKELSKKFKITRI